MSSPRAFAWPIPVGLVLFALACGGAPDEGASGSSAFVSSASADAGDPADAAVAPDADPDADAGIAPDGSDGPPAHVPCTSQFGSGLASGSHGRLDGVLLSIVPPGGHTCGGDADHLHLQIGMSGSVYDIAVNIERDVAFATTNGPLTTGAWSEGWHPEATLDYPTALGLHSSARAFTTTTESALVARLVAELERANHVSIYATKYSRGGAHLVHRNGNGRDGAIVLDPLSASPRYLVFRFTNQTF